MRTCQNERSYVLRNRTLTTTAHLVFACSSLVALTFVVSIRMFLLRVHALQTKRVNPQAVALAAGRDEIFDDSRAADNFRNLFEVPVLFYALCAIAIATNHLPSWLPIAAWAFVALRIAHSAIQCGYNNVMHRFKVFVAGYLLLVVTWAAFVVSFTAKTL